MLWQDHNLKCCLQTAETTLLFQAIPQGIQTFLLRGSFTLQGTSGSHINHPVMDGHPMPGSCVPPLLIEQQHLILPGYWRLIYTIQLQSKLWFFTVKDSSIWRVCTETIKDQNAAQKSSPKIRGLPDYCVLAPQLSAPQKIIKWSSSKEKKERKKAKKPVWQSWCCSLKNTWLYLNT